VSDIDTAVVDSLKVLDPKRPIREADIQPRLAAIATSSALMTVRAPYLIFAGVAPLKGVDKSLQSRYAFLRKLDYGLVPIPGRLSVCFCGPVQPGLPNGGYGNVQRFGQFCMENSVK
jgi:hypothetical protein